MPTYQLYGHELSGNVYKVRLLLTLLGLPFTEQRVDLFAGEASHPSYLALNPLGQVPVLVSDGTSLRDSQAILFFLAERHGAGTWLSSDGSARAETIAWLSLAANELANGPAALRLAARFNIPVDLERAKVATGRALGLMQAVLSLQPWLMAGTHPTIADIACFPYVALAHEGNVSLTDFPAVLAWCDRIRALPGFVPMEGL
jgi:glutathione S-transferase